MPPILNRMKTIMLCLVLSSITSFAWAARPVALVEILFLNEGKTAEQANLYFAKAYEISKRYGAEPIAGMRLKRWMRGGSDGIYNAHYIVGAEFPNEAALKNMMDNDKDFDGLLFEKDTIFDSRKTITFEVEPLRPPE